MIRLFFDNLAMLLILSCNIMYFIRKGILGDYGYPFSPFDIELKDGKHLKRVIDSLPNGVRKKRLTMINNSVSILFVASCATFLLPRIVLLFVRKISNQ